jgi:hypothetical protein
MITDRVVLADFKAVNTLAIRRVAVLGRLLG